MGITLSGPVRASPTEHVLNQYNSFKVIHEETRPGGCMRHQLPASGFPDYATSSIPGTCFSITPR